MYMYLVITDMRAFCVIFEMQCTSTCTIYNSTVHIPEGIQGVFIDVRDLFSQGPGGNSKRYFLKMMD